MNDHPLELHFKELQELDQVAGHLLAMGRQVPVWLFRGGMGAGKTTLIKKICELLHVPDQVQSPTFSIVNEYLTEQNVRIYHFDFYRIRNEAEAYDIGVEEYLDSGDYCFIEWPDKIESLWPETYLMIDMEQEPDGTRILKAAMQSDTRQQSFNHQG
jgi:tRNA threonylcarbamoyladenosine biosynthesis protein TsaE